MNDKDFQKLIEMRKLLKEAYDLDLIVNGVNISETIKNLLGKLVV